MLSGLHKTFDIKHKISHLLILKFDRVFQVW